MVFKSGAYDGFSDFPHVVPHLWGDTREQRRALAERAMCVAAKFEFESAARIELVPPPYPRNRPEFIRTEGRFPSTNPTLKRVELFLHIYAFLHPRAISCTQAG